MRSPIGAPGDGISRREFLAATGATGVAATAGCTTTRPSVSNVNVPVRGPAAMADLPTTGRPEVIDLWEWGNEVTLKPVKVVHHLHPDESMNGPLALPVILAWRADDGTPSVPGPILRVREGDEFTMKLDNGGMDNPHTLPVHGA